MTPDLPAGRQLHLDFPRVDPSQRPLIEWGPYAPAVALIRRWRDWPEGQLALTGAAFSGKSHLLRVWAVEAGAAVVGGAELSSVSIDEISALSFNALAIDDADLGAEGMGLLTALNLCRSRNAPVLITGRGGPGGWFTTPPDLRSRLAAMPRVEIGAPDDDSLAARLHAECASRHLILPEESVRYLAARMERSWEAVAGVAAQVERTPGRASTPRLARRVLQALGVDPG